MRLRLWAAYSYTKYEIPIPNTEYFSFLFLFFSFLGCFCFFFLNWVLSCISPAPHWHQSFFAIVFRFFYVSTCAHNHHPRDRGRGGDRDRPRQKISQICAAVRSLSIMRNTLAVGSQNNIIIFGHRGHNWPAPLPELTPYPPPSSAPDCAGLLVRVVGPDHSQLPQLWHNLNAKLAKLC